jgi:hypothetical protein
MIEFIKKYYGKIGMGFALVMLVINYYQQRELTRLRNEPKIEVYTGGDIQKGKLIDSLMNMTDSLRDELFIERVDAGRHEVTREEILTKYPKVAKEYDDFYTHQTE